MMQMVKPQETYITNGLVLWLDGINRGGISGKWKNLVGDHIVTMTGLYTELSDGIEFPATSTPYGYGEFDSSTGIEINYDAGTIEVCIESASGEAGTGRPTLTILNDKMGGSIANNLSTGAVAMRWYPHSGNMSSWAFSDVNSAKLTASGNSDRGICNGISGSSASTTSWGKSGGKYMFASRGTGNPFKGIYHCLRVYNRKLTEEEILHNQHIDNVRFNLGLNI